ncbi:sulfurtransferase [Aestuariirhabdus litorea]|uniref:Sulfurtransferase n=1 Tax=Aestuariirhabdus litorea TaxID=2528527 RepID=A0A3P3VNK0_9GAMM|nr:sulfurtransferase [Aestuariirhabdus litorea]RRJ84331.1 sulfurtransferase [Aestuariirhabdus litorea]RWW97554.1 sulfurtransferase [Endozoicomonadaceae bacterium GTF-13]
MAERAEALIEVGELQERIGSPDWVLFDCRFSLADKEQGARAYQQGHIPGAWYADLEKALSGPVVAGQTGRHPLPEPGGLTRFLTRCGLRDGATAVVYDDNNGAMAARLWWLLRYLGVESVRLLNGGFSAWQAEGGDLSTLSPQPKGNEGVLTVRPNPQLLVSAEEILAGLDEDRFCLVDARAEPRFRGEVEPIDPVAGHIPGAHCYPFEENLGEDGRFKSSAELKRRFASLAHNASPLVCYCGSGVTACHNLLAMELAGLPMAKLYPGSWSEWITDPARPLAAG